MAFIARALILTVAVTALASGAPKNRPAGGDASWSVSADQPPVVVIEPGAGRPVVRAAADLSRYLGRILGRAVYVAAPRPGQPSIVLKRAEGMGDEEYEIGAEGGTLRLRSGGDLGLAYAAYELLRRYGGCRFSGLAPDSESVPETGRLTAANLPLRMKPKLWYRGLQLTNLEKTDLAIRSLDWMVKNGYNYAMVRGGTTAYGVWYEASLRREIIDRGLKTDMNHHNLFAWLPAERYFKAHPEWFPEVDGKRVASIDQLSICSSNPAAVRTVVENVLGYLRSHPEVRIVGVIPGDGDLMCHCAACTKMDVESGIDPQEQYRDIGTEWRRSRKGANLAKTRRYTNLVNQVARAVKAEFPGVLVGYGAYRDLVWPDETVRLEPNVVTWVAAYWIDGARPLTADSPSALNRNMFQALSEWKRRSPGRVITYSYYLGMNAQVSLPYPEDRLIPGDWEALKAIGIEGATLQNWPSHLEAYGLNLLAFVRSGWSDKVDPDALLDEYLEGMYGSAAAAVKPIYEGLHEAWRRLDESGRGAFPDGSTITTILDVLDKERLDGILKSARAKADAGREARQVERLAAWVEYWRLAAEGFRLERAAQEARGPEKKALFGRAAAQCRAILDHVATMSDGWAANTVPVLWENARKRCAAAAR